jgi:hypothetical protein
LPDTRSKVYSSFTVSLSSLAVSSSDSSDNQDYLSSTLPVVLDSGTTLTYLPSPVVKQIYATFDAVDDTNNTGLVYVNCDLLSRQKDTTFDFRFGDSSGPLVRVPMDEMVLDNVKGYVDIGLILPDLPFDDACSFGIQSLSGYYLLGDTFLRSAYVVYDLSNKKIALAQANLNATDSNILEITKSSGIPLVSGVASQGTVTPIPIPTSTGLSATGDQSKPTSAIPTVTVTQTPSDSASGNAAARAAPALNWEAAAVTLMAAFCSLAGATLFIL